MKHNLLGKDKLFWKALGVSASVNILSLITGFTQGFSAIILPEIHVSDDTASWIASLGVITNPIGALLSGFMMDKLGRRRALQLAYAPFIVGWIMLATADDVMKICIGRAVTGVGIGMGTTCYVYVAEVTRPEDRGLLSLFGPSFLSLGVLLIYTFGYVMHWKSAAMFSFICSIIGCILLHPVPETPVWLHSKGQETKAAEVTAWFTGAASESSNANPVHNGKSSEDNFFRSFVKTKSWKPLLIMMIFFVLQVGSGLYVMVFYAVDFVNRSGSSIQPNLVSIALASIRTIMAVIGSLAVMKYDRKLMIMSAGAGMGVTMLLAGIYLFKYDGLSDAEKPFNFVQPLLLLNIAFSMLGIFQLPWTLPGELFPHSVRGIMNGIIPTFGNVIIFSTIKMYPMLMDKLGMVGAMWLFSGFSFATVLFGKYILPETRNKSLEEIELMFNKNAKVSCEQTVPGDKFQVP